jgi:hypothetical protein
LTGSGVFPFGAPVRPVPPSRSVPSDVLVLGANPSALHVAWTPPCDSGLQPVRALAVDNEPSPFWDGGDEAQRVADWAAAHFNDAWGAVHPAEGLNGSSGRWVVASVLSVLDVEPADVWFTDCLDAYRAGEDQAARLADIYAPFARARGLPAAELPTHVSEAQIVREAMAAHAERLAGELQAAAPAIVVTLGDAAARVFGSLTNQPGEGGGLQRAGYGLTRVVEWEGRSLQWLALVHPEAPPEWQHLHRGWMDEQQVVIGEVVEDEEPAGRRPSRLLVRRLLTAGVDVPRVLAVEAVSRLADSAVERAAAARRRSPQATPEDLIARAIDRGRRLARTEGFVAGVSLTASELTSVFGTAGVLTIPSVVLNLAADLTTLAWIQTRMVLEIAALHGHDLNAQDDLVRDVLQLWAPHHAVAPMAAPWGKGLQRVGRRVLERYLKGPALKSLTQLFRIVGIKFTRAGLIRALPGLNIVANVAVNDQSTKMLGKRADAYFR